MKRIVLAFAVLLASQRLCAQAGSLDLTFNLTGFVITSVSADDDYGNAIAIQPDGKILAGGGAKFSGVAKFALCRYNTDGSLDNTFGTGGMVTTAIGTSFDASRGIALQPDGKIVLGGCSLAANLDFAIVRYNADGALDNTFGTGGKTTTAVGAGNDAGSCLAMQADGKFIIAGKVAVGSGNNFGLVRYKSDGTVDSTFGTNGIQITAFNTGGYAQAEALAIQADGKIVVAGRAGNSVFDSFAVARYNTDGSLDNSFSGDGLLSIGFGIATSNSDYGRAVALQADGKIIVGGQARIGANDDFAMVRLNTDGSIDASFGTSGKVTTAMGPDQDYIRALAIQADGKIIGAGNCYPGTTFLDFALARYNTDGSLDAGFGVGGKAISELGVGTNQIDAIALQTDGKIVAVGQVNAGPTSDFAVARYYSNGTSTGLFSQAFAMQPSLIYPNPASNKLNIRIAAKPGKVTATLQDVSCHILISEELAGPQNLTWNIENIPAGIYLVTISQDDERMTKLVSKQ